MSDKLKAILGPVQEHGRPHHEHHFVHRAVLRPGDTVATACTLHAPPPFHFRPHHHPSHCRDVPDGYVQVGRWKTHAEFEMRRILVLTNPETGIVVGFRPCLQQGKGASRKTHSTVYRVTAHMDEEAALVAAKRWRDDKERELGICNGGLSASSSGKVVQGLSLIVSRKAPYRAHWSSPDVPGSKRVRVSIGRRSYQEAYEIAARQLAEIRGIPTPEHIPLAPRPSAEQYERLLSIGVTGIPSPTVEALPDHGQTSQP